MYTPLATAVANRLTEQLSSPQVNVWIPKTSVGTLFFWISAAQRSLHGLQAQRLRYRPLLALLESQLRKMLRDVPYASLSYKDITTLSTACASIFYASAHLDFVRPEADFYALLNVCCEGVFDIFFALQLLLE